MPADDTEPTTPPQPESPPLPISVCICTHNPDPLRLTGVLDAIDRQTLGRDQWELVVIDNASAPPVAAVAAKELARFPDARVVIEPELGLVHARRRAIDESRGCWIVFFDDDNFPDPDYLEQILTAARETPGLAACGGRCLGRFEVKPPSWSRLYLPYLAVRDWGDLPRFADGPRAFEHWMPVGAGLAVRRDAARAWADRIRAAGEQSTLGRRGDQLGGSEDIDLVLTTLDGGHGVAYLPQLRLWHYIPAARLRYDYMKRLVHESIRSATQLQRLRNPSLRPRRRPLEHIASLACTLRAGAFHPRALALALEIAEGRYAAHEELDCGRN